MLIIEEIHMLSGAIPVTSCDLAVDVIVSFYTIYLDSASFLLASLLLCLVSPV